jgi:transcription elongation factor/antiterminator RfaH
MSIKDPKWHVVYTMSKNEKKIFNTLTKQKIYSFLPLHQLTRQWCDRKKHIHVPIFPNYVFVKICPDQKWMVQSICGVIRFVSFGNMLAVVPDHEIDIIKKLEANNIEVSHETNWVKGDKVRIIRGPLTGLEGVINDKRGEGRLFLELKAIDRIVSISIDSHSIQMAHEFV